MLVNYVRKGDVIEATKDWIIEKVHGNARHAFLSVSQDERSQSMLNNWWFKADLSIPHVNNITGTDGTGLVGKAFVVVSAGRPHGEVVNSAGHSMEENPLPYTVSARLLTKDYTLKNPAFTIVFNQGTQESLYCVNNPKVLGVMPVLTDVGAFRPRRT